MPRQRGRRREWVNRGAGLNDIGTEVTKLAAESGLSPITARVLWMRGLRDADAVRDFFYPRLARMTRPQSIQDLERGCQRLLAARDAGEKVFVFGDYDVDGTTGAALLGWVFRFFGYDYTLNQPDRFKDGYGLNVAAVERAKATGHSLIVTVDCGISSFAAADKAQELGLDLVILDHHQVDPKRGLPPACAIINPQREDCRSGLKQLCGCALAFYFSIGLRELFRARGDDVPNLSQHLDLVVIATAADQVPLVGDNRILVRHGLHVLRRSTKPGVNALLQVAGVTRATLSPGHLAFTLGPRINASGRMLSPVYALELLTTTDPVEATKRAQTLEKLNRERADLQGKIWDEVKKQVDQGLDQGRFKHGIAIGSSNWHEGVVGIVASKVTETYHRPAIVIAINGERAKGSARTWAGKDVLAAVRTCEKLLVGFGGHKHAAGLSLAASDLDQFAELFDQAVAKIPEDRTQVPLLFEGECSLEDFDFKALKELEQLGPFGPGNPEPLFKIKAGVRSQRVIKDRHLKLNLGPVGTKKGPALEAIWFYAAEDHQGEWPVSAEWVGVPELNRFRGRVTPSFRIRDFRPEAK